MAISVSHGGESLPREATRRSSLCEVALARAREAASRVEEAADHDDESSGDEDEDDEDDDDNDGTNVADADAAEEAAKSAAPAIRAARRTGCFVDLRSI